MLENKWVIQKNKIKEFAGMKINGIDGIRGIEQYQEDRKTPPIYQSEAVVGDHESNDHQGLHKRSCP